MGIQITALEHISLGITDVSQARKFYGEVLGLEEVERPENLTIPGAWYRMGGVMLHLVERPSRDRDGAVAHFCLWAEDIYQAAKTIEAAGFEVQWERKKKIPGVDRFFTRDPAGNLIELKGSDGTVWAA